MKYQAVVFEVQDERAVNGLSQAFLVVLAERCVLPGKRVAGIASGDVIRIKNDPDFDDSNLIMRPE